MVVIFTERIVSTLNSSPNISTGTTGAGILSVHFITTASGEPVDNGTELNIITPSL